MKSITVSECPECHDFPEIREAMIPKNGCFISTGYLIQCRQPCHIVRKDMIKIFLPHIWVNDSSKDIAIKKWNHECQELLRK